MRGVNPSRHGAGMARPIRTVNSLEVSWHSTSEGDSGECMHQIVAPLRCDPRHLEEKRQGDDVTSDGHVEVQSGLGECLTSIHSFLSGYRGQMSSGRKYGLLTFDTRIFYILLERSSKHPTHQARLGQKYSIVGLNIAYMRHRKTSAIR